MSRQSINCYLVLLAARGPPFQVPFSLANYLQTYRKEVGWGKSRQVAQKSLQLEVVFVSFEKNRVISPLK